MGGAPRGACAASPAAAYFAVAEAYFAEAGIEDRAPVGASPAQRISSHRRLRQTGLPLFFARNVAQAPSDLGGFSRHAG